MSSKRGRAPDASFVCRVEKTKWPVTEKVGKLILERASASDIEKLAREEGMITLEQDGFLKVTEGITTLEEVLRVAQE